MRALAFYASTSGSTRSLMDVLVATSKVPLRAIDIACENDFPPLKGFDIVIAATPTYGQGDAHYLWRRRGAQIFRALPKGQVMALIALADARGHPRTFAGGLKELRALAEEARPILRGAVPSADYAFEHSASEQNGMFPGLVLEYRRNRRTAEARATVWMGQLVAQMYAPKTLEVEA